MPAALRYIAPVFRVADLARSLGFYRDKLGFDVEWSYEGFYACVLRDGCRIHLNCASATPRDQAAFAREEHLDACVVVNDAGELAAQLRGVEFTVPLRTMPYGKEFYVRDPDGYVLGFVEPA